MSTAIIEDMKRTDHKVSKPAGDGNGTYSGKGKKVEKAGCEYLHIDVMDGHFVPNITLGPGIVKSLRKDVNMVFDEPNLIRYLLTDSKALVAMGQIGAVFDETKNRTLCEALSRVVGFSEEKAREFMNTVVIYTQGLVTFIIDGTITVSREEALQMLENVGVMHMVYAGIPYEKARVLLRQ